MKKILFVVICLALMTGCSISGFKSVDTQRFASVISNPEVQLVDVRTAEEYAEGHIVGAINIDVQSPDFAEKISVLDKNRKVAVYCRSGRRSKMAAEQLTAAGYKVIDLDGGIQSWTGEIEK